MKEESFDSYDKKPVVSYDKPSYVKKETYEVKKTYEKPAPYTSYDKPAYEKPIYADKPSYVEKSYDTYDKGYKEESYGDEQKKVGISQSVIW